MIKSPFMFTAVIVIFALAGCSKKERPSSSTQTNDVQTPPVPAASGNPATASLCEKAVNTLGSCIVTPRFDKKKAKALVNECEQRLKSQSPLFVKETSCFAKLNGNCSGLETCLPDKNKDVCQIFADTRIKCGRTAFSRQKEVVPRLWLVSECQKDMKEASTSKELMESYACYKSAREVCYSSSPCYRKHSSLKKAQWAAMNREAEAKLAKLGAAGRSLHTNCITYADKCMDEMRNIPPKKRKKLFSEVCKHELFTEHAPTKKRIGCIKANASAFAQKGADVCAPVKACIMKKQSTPRSR